ncbi:MAG: hypothetical protein AAFN77_07625 [Planctomycetota bacterium]
MTKSSLILQKLSRMRGQLSRWIIVHGLGRWLLVILAVLAVDMALDRLFKMDFAQRLVMLVVMVASIGFYFAWKVIRPLFARASDTALIYEVEQKHPELKEALISSFQLSRENVAQHGMSRALADATIEQGNRQAADLNFGDALNLPKSRWNAGLLLAGLLVIGMLGWGVTSNSFLKTWFNRNVMLGNDQWPQQTYLEIAGVKDGKLTISRGSDHRQLVYVSENSSVKDVSVSLVVDNPAGRSVLPMKPTGKSSGREHLFTFHNVSSTFRFRARGGDEATDWVEVELVEPPSIIDLKLESRLPEYTRVEKESLVGSGPHSILRGSSLEIGIKTNKALSSAALRFGDERFDMSRASSDQDYSLTVPSEGELKGGEYEFELVDQADVASNRKSKFKVVIKEDKPPKVRANLLGISGEVVPRAMIPTSYQAADEYGLAKLTFDCKWKSGDQEDSPIRSELITIANDGQEGLLEEPTNRVQTVTVLDLTQLKLEPGISFKMRVAAQDFYPEDDNIGYSQEFLLRVVTESQLRASLLRREIEQREAFNQAYEKQLALATELQAIQVRQRPNDVTEDDFRAQQEARLIAAVREQKSIGTAIDAVANRFEEFLVEVKNNRLDEAENEIAPEQRIEARFDEKIIQPIRRLDAELISLAVRHMDGCRVNANDPEELANSATRADGVHQQILLDMKNILAAMSDSENFQGIINDILEIKRDTEAINKGIDQKKPGDSDIFDNDDIFNK